MGNTHELFIIRKEDNDFEIKLPNVKKTIALGYKTLSKLTLLFKENKEFKKLTTLDKRLGKLNELAKEIILKNGKINSNLQKQEVIEWINNLSKIKLEEDILLEFD